MINRQPVFEPLSLDALRSGDRAEFSRFVEVYSDVIYRIAFKMLENPQDAEDVLQETFIKAFRGLKNFEGRSSLSTWLYRIATNEALMILRRNKQVFVSIDEPLEDEGETPPPRQFIDWCCLPEEELMSAEGRVNLDRAIETLSPNLRIVFVLRDLEGLSTQETGEILNISEMAVKTRLSRARFRLREELSKYYQEWLPRQETTAEGGS